MRTVEEIRQGLEGVRLEVVAAETGLSFNTVRRYARGDATPANSRHTSIRLLSEWLDGQERLAQTA